ELVREHDQRSKSLPEPSSPVAAATTLRFSHRVRPVVDYQLEQKEAPSQEPAEHLPTGAPDSDLLVSGAAPSTVNSDLESTRPFEWGDTHIQQIALEQPSSPVTPPDNSCSSLRPLPPSGRVVPPDNVSRRPLRHLRVALIATILVALVS